MKIVSQNKKAYHDYEILDKVEAGIVLTGDEVKSVRAGKVNLAGSFARPKGNELFLINCHISTYSHAYQKSDEESRHSRKLLLNRREIDRLIGAIAKKSVTLVPLKMYINKKGLIKLDLGVCKHKKAKSRKEELKKRDIEREARSEIRSIK